MNAGDRAPAGPDVRRARGSGSSRLAPCIDFEFGGTTWRALPDRAAFWLAQRWLVVADAHFGKAATFRARGLPVPTGTTGANLARLSALIESTQPERLVFLGDLLHAREAQAAESMRQFAAWRARHAGLEVTRVEGNHDRHAGAPPPSLGIEPVGEPWVMHGIAFRHHPQRGEIAVVAGHVHPCVRLYGSANETLRLPCFWRRDRLLMLPAFGEFTGGAPIEREAGDLVIAVADRRLIEIPPLPAAR